MPSIITVFHRIADSYVNRYLRRFCSAPKSVRFLRSAHIRNQSTRPDSIRVGANSVVGGQLHVFPDGGHIHIGEYCFIGPETRIWAGDAIEIGDRVLISHGVNIHDSIAHSLSAIERHRHFIEIILQGNGALGNVPKKRIVIEDDVWIGFNAVIMKGVRIGRGAVVAAGAIVTKDVPPFSIVSGSAAQHIKYANQ